jgi:hypothetical protein
MATTSSGLGFGSIMNAFTQLAPSVIAYMNLQDQRKQLKKENMVTEWKLAQQAKAANNKLKWSNGLQQSLEGQEISPGNQRQEYDSAPRMT